jgi:hypothetical protein
MEWHEGNTIGWYATDLVRLNLIQTEEEWEELIDIVNETAMKYFKERVANVTNN